MEECADVPDARKRKSPAEIAAANGWQSGYDGFPCGSEYTKEEYREAYVEAYIAGWDARAREIGGC